MNQELDKNITQESPIGVIFDSINYYKLEDLDKFIESMNQDQALYCIVQAAQSAYKRNAFNLAESEVLSKAIRKLTQQQSPKEEQ
jgi:tRNA(Leu) C34 or U34 (ribose-2'-O)-methylase TrmL